MFFSLVSLGRQARAWRPFAFTLVWVLAAGLAACSSFGASRPVEPQPQRDVLTRDEIWRTNAHQGDLLQAIRSLRPEYLVRPRGAVTRQSASALPLVVVIQGIRQGGVDVLHNISASRVLDVRYLDPTAASNLYGPTASGGALVVKFFEETRPPEEV